MNLKQMNELLLQSLEHERGGIQIYETALRCVRNEKLSEEWKQYLEQTREHEAALSKVCKAFGLDLEEQTPGRSIVRQLGEALVTAMVQALKAGSPEAAQLTACECIVLAETKDHLDWQLLGKCSEGMSDAAGEELRSAYERIEDQEDEHLYHTKGWCRELWMESLGLEAVIPPLEEVRHVKTAMGAARAEQASNLER